MKVMRYHIAVFAMVPMLALFAASCGEREELPDEPVINEIWFDTDQNELKIRFTDGDGDFGLSANDTEPPFNVLNEDSTPNFFYNNLHVDIFFRENNEWVPVVQLPDSPGQNFRIPDLTPQGQSKQLRVLITYDFRSANTEMRANNPNMDTVMYRVVLVDRALNISLPAETDPVVPNFQ